MEERRGEGRGGEGREGEGRGGKRRKKRRGERKKRKEEREEKEGKGRNVGEGKEGRGRKGGEGRSVEESQSYGTQPFCWELPWLHLCLPSLQLTHVSFWQQTVAPEPGNGGTFKWEYSSQERPIEFKPPTPT